MRDDRAPIANLEAELGYLGCALMDGNLVTELDATLLQDIRHQELVLQLKKMHAGGKPISGATLAVFLQSSGKVHEVGGSAYVIELEDATPSSANFTYFRDGLCDAALRRRQEAAGQAIALRARDLTTPPLEAQALAETEILALRPKAAAVRKTNREALREIIKEMEYANENPGALNGLATGFRALDSMLWGIAPGQLIVVGGRPSQGKSAFITQIAHFCAKNGTSSGYLSLEMSQKEILFRLQCAISGVDGHTARSGQLSQDEQERFLVAMSGLCSCPMRIEDGDLSTMELIASAARGLIKDEGIGLLVVDYLQLIQGSNRKAGRYEAVSEVSAALKKLARQLNIPIIVGSQLSREVAKEDRRPRLDDLRDSGSIEQDADVVLLIHNRNDEEQDSRTPSELIVSKQRNGRLGPVELTFNKPLYRFEEAPL